MKKVHFAVICFVLVAVMPLLLYAAPSKRFDAQTGTCRILDQGVLEWESRPWGEGGKLFKQMCKSCHTRSNNQGATFLWEESKTSRGWNNVFARQRAQCAKDGVWAKLSEEQLLRVNDYLYRWASDAMDVNDSA